MERWDETAIVNRGEILREQALEIWPHHGIPQEIEQGQRNWTLADHHHLTGEIMELFQQLRRHILNLDALGARADYQALYCLQAPHDFCKHLTAGKASPFNLKPTFSRYR